MTNGDELTEKRRRSKKPSTPRTVFAVAAGGAANCLLMIGGFWFPPMGWFIGGLVGTGLGAYLASAVSRLPPKPAGLAAMGSVLAAFVISLFTWLVWILYALLMFVLPVALPASFAIGYFVSKRRSQSDLPLPRAANTP